LAVLVDEVVREDPVQPRLEVGALTELVVGGERLGDGLLDEILGVGRVAGQPHGGRVELLGHGHDVPLEPGTPLLFRHRDHPNPLRTESPTTLPAPPYTHTRARHDRFTLHLRSHPPVPTPRVAALE